MPIYFHICSLCQQPGPQYRNTPYGPHFKIFQVSLAKTLSFRATAIGLLSIHMIFCDGPRPVCLAGFPPTTCFTAGLGGLRPILFKRMCMIFYFNAFDTVPLIFIFKTHSFEEYTLLYLNLKQLQQQILRHHTFCSQI